MKEIPINGEEKLSLNDSIDETCQFFQYAFID